MTWQCKIHKEENRWMSCDGCLLAYAFNNNNLKETTRRQNELIERVKEKEETKKRMIVDFRFMWFINGLIGFIFVALTNEMKIFGAFMIALSGYMIGMWAEEICSNPESEKEEVKK